jgi:hypothetical protein
MARPSQMVCRYGVVCAGALALVLSTQAAARQVAGSSGIPPISAEKAFVHVVQLAGSIGERPGGSKAEERSADYIHGMFKSWGLDSRIETFPIAIWHPRSARLWTEGDQPLSLPSKAVAFCGTTPPEGIGGELVDVGTASKRHLDGKDLAGKIVLVKRDAEADYPDYWLTERLLPRKVAGMIFYTRAGRPGGIPMAYYNFKRSLKEKTPPSVVITYEDAIRLLQSQPRRVTIAVNAEVTWGESRNIVAEIRGRVRPEEVVLISAHNETTIGSPGAGDDTGGVARVLELARAFSVMPPPARTLRFITWGGHEEGLMGSEAYLRAHPDETNRIFAGVLFHDGYTLGTDQWRGAGPDEWIRFVRQIADESGLEPGSSIGAPLSDGTNFAALEVPTVIFSQGLTYGASHTPEDNLKWCSPVGLEGGLLLGAMLVSRLANDLSLSFPHRFPPDLLKQVRDVAARWGWGVRPEANKPPSTEGEPPGPFRQNK